MYYYVRFADAPLINSTRRLPSREPPRRSLEPTAPGIQAARIMALAAQKNLKLLRATECGEGRATEDMKGFNEQDV